MADFTFLCPHCSTELTADTAQCSHPCDCPACSQEFTIPAVPPLRKKPSLPASVPSVPAPRPPRIIIDHGERSNLQGGGCLMLILCLLATRVFPLAFVGCILGFVLLLLGFVRSPSYRCPVCGNTVNAESLLCPACRSGLRAASSAPSWLTIIGLAIIGILLLTWLALAKPFG